jgi:hypothetical protein
MEMSEQQSRLWQEMINLMQKYIDGKTDERSKVLILDDE